MKRKLLFSLIATTLFSCSGYKDYEKLIADWAETNAFQGVRTDLKIKFIESSISDIHVADSIAILKKQFQEEQAKKIEEAKKMVSGYQQLSEVSSLYNSELRRAETELREAESWHPDYLDRYAGHNPNEVIAKKVSCKMSYQEPKLTTRQEKQGTFILSVDEKRVIKMIRE